MGKCVFTNCASFLKFSDPIDVFDQSRIHPQDYRLGRKMIADAWELADYYDDNIDADEELIQLYQDGSPEEIERKLMELDLEDYARQLFESTGQSIHLQLEQIRQELISPYRDLRGEYKGLSLSWSVYKVSNRCNRWRNLFY